MGEAKSGEAVTISFLMLTIDRFEITKQCWETNVKHAKMQMPSGAKWVLEFLIADNGSTDKRVVDYFAAQNISYHRVNKSNEGIGRALNQLFLRSTGDYICLLGNDLELPPGWLAKAMEYADNTPRPGLFGFNWGHGGVPALSTKFGLEAHWLAPPLDRVFGSWVFKRELIDEVGLFPEHYDVYGLEDSAMNERVNRAKRNSAYVPGFRSKHLVHDVGQNTAYRKMKDASLAKNVTLFSEQVKSWNEGASIKEPLPPLRDPL